MNSGTQTANAQKTITLLSFREEFKKNLKKRMAFSLFVGREPTDCEYNNAIDKALTITDQIILDQISEGMKPGESFEMPGRGSFAIIDDVQAKEQHSTPNIPSPPPGPPKKQGFSLENFTPTKRQWRAKHNPSGLYLGKLTTNHREGITTNIHTIGTICKRRPSADQVIYSWYKDGSIQDQDGHRVSLLSSDITIERYQ